MDLKKIFINFALLGLLVFSIMSFIIIFQSDNNSGERITDNQLINKTYNDLYGNLSNAQEEAQKQNNLFGRTTKTESEGELQIDSVVSPTKTSKTLVLGIYNILIKLPMNLFGVSTVVASIISAILILIVIIAIWAVWKGSIT